MALHKLRATIPFTLVWLAGVQLCWTQDGAQARLETVSLGIAGHRVTAELADEPGEMATGLMFRESLGENEGMLFMLPAPTRASFWMKNTTIPLSIAFIDLKGRILEIHDLEPGNETPVRSHFSNIAYALEMRRGWFSERKIIPGDVVQGLPHHPTAR